METKEKRKKHQQSIFCVIRKLFALLNGDVVVVVGNFSFLLFIGMTFGIPVVKYVMCVCACMFLCPIARENWTKKQTLNVADEKCNKPEHCAHRTHIHAHAQTLNVRLILNKP